jgi:hypothetical protein
MRPVLARASSNYPHPAHSLPTSNQVSCRDRVEARRLLCTSSRFERFDLSSIARAPQLLYLLRSVIGFAASAGL